MNQRTYPQGVPSWVDTEQPDVEAAIDFYGGLFGWTFEDVMPPGAPGRYLIAKLDGLDVAGLGSGGERTAWNTYIAVDDADDAVSKLVTAGAKVVSTPEDAGEGGRSAALADRKVPGSASGRRSGGWGRRWSTSRVPGISATSTRRTPARVLRFTRRHSAGRLTTSGSG
ncbi:putative enzyme related to lactoylglutathione lyase [Arthrobacter sp. V1I9]|uniref:VOC family protein n=1 Tax=Arthrobacter sp. V1I9 TaxID=3042275 RepID=UPI0027925B16|nr:VOC family protein [Arthrobacter sp. V1I9]MDQ0868374.1 putative enzyme related to lactoylglutathione lyase [Arthrobacter sp. V1I9]